MKNFENSRTIFITEVRRLRLLVMSRVRTGAIALVTLSSLQHAKTSDVLNWKNWTSNWVLWNRCTEVSITWGSTFDNRVLISSNGRNIPLVFQSEFGKSCLFNRISTPFPPISFCWGSASENVHLYAKAMFVVNNVFFQFLKECWQMSCSW